MTNKHALNNICSSQCMRQWKHLCWFDYYIYYTYFKLPYCTPKMMHKYALIIKREWTMQTAFFFLGKHHNYIPLEAFPQPPGTVWAFDVSWEGQHWTMSQPWLTHRMHISLEKMLLLFHSLWSNTHQTYRNPKDTPRRVDSSWKASFKKCVHMIGECQDAASSFCFGVLG